MIKRFFAQFSNPHGFLGKIVGWVLVANNDKRNSLAVEKLEPKSDERILEIGFGPGVTIQKIFNKAEDIFVAGIDISDVMLKQASNRNRKYINENKAVLKQGSVESIPFEENYFDKTIVINVCHFFPDPVENFKEIKRVLKPGGILLNVFQPRMAKNIDDVLVRADKLKTQVRDAGFANVEFEIIEMKPIDCIFLKCVK
ncbi:MAG: hypothetical protein A2068_14670 [Ignavibacteria bacterium GWB2_35_6b]|nr:MAG: hypothetical protein A2068_14670 [Ignavibacteria bacterium GWB2_35_6b]